MKPKTRPIFQSCVATLIVGGCTVLANDHPLITPYTGSKMAHRTAVEFDETTIPLGPVKDGKLTKSQRVEGKITRLDYANPQGRTPLEIYRNYEAAVKQGGFEILFTCGPSECGSGSAWSANIPACGRHWAGRSPRHLSARMARPEGDVWLALEVEPDFTYVFIIETKVMDTGMVTVNAATLASDIARQGHTAVYGILFDTAKADVKPDSEPVLVEIAKLLREHPKLSLHVIGHTDSTGDLSSNIDLSRRRAAAVIQALTSKHGIAAARLQSHAIGPLSPVASNDSEHGRAKNRRVESVKQ